MAHRPPLQKNICILVHFDGRPIYPGADGQIPTHQEINELIARITRFYQQTTPDEIEAYNIRGQLRSEREMGGHR